jgi:hypothetical protein
MCIFQSSYQHPKDTDSSAQRLQILLIRNIKKKHGPVAQTLRLISLVLTSSPQAQEGGSLALLGHGPWILMWKMMVQ